MHFIGAFSYASTGYQTYRRNLNRKVTELQKIFCEKKTFFFDLLKISVKYPVIFPQAAKLSETDMPARNVDGKLIACLPCSDCGFFGPRPESSRPEKSLRPTARHEAHTWRSPSE